MDGINLTQSFEGKTARPSFKAGQEKQSPDIEAGVSSEVLDCVSFSKDTSLENKSGGINRDNDAESIEVPVSAADGEALEAATRLADVSRQATLAVACSTTPSLNLLILGGTGFLGQHLVQAALDRGHNVTIFNRGKTAPGLFPNVETLIGDRDGDLSALNGRTWDAVIDTSAWKPNEVEASASLLAPNVKHYTFISSISAYKDSSVPGMDESAPVYESGFMHFGLGKALCEKAAESAMPGRVLNIRPGLIVGPGDNSDRFTYWVERMDSGGKVLVPDCPDRKVQFIDARDLAKWTIKAVEDGQTGVFNAVGEPLTMGEVLEECRNSAGAGKSAPQPVNEEWLQKQGVNYYSDLPLWLPYDESVSSARAQSSGLTFRPLSETVRDTLEWARGRDKETPRRAGLSPERETELLNEWTNKKVAITCAR